MMKRISDPLGRFVMDVDPRTWAFVFTVTSDDAKEHFRPSLHRVEGNGRLVLVWLFVRLSTTLVWDLAWGLMKPRRV